MTVCRMAVFLFLLVQVFVPMLAAQAVRRLADPHPGLGRRIVGNCTAGDTNCQFCAAAVLVTWSSRYTNQDLIATVTLQEVVNEDGSVDLETITPDWDASTVSWWSEWREMKASGPKITFAENLGFKMTYPTPYVVLPESYEWQGTLFTDNACSISTDKPVLVDAKPTVRPVPGGGYSILPGDYTDTLGYFFDINTDFDAVDFYDATLGANFDEGAFKSCKPVCGGDILPVTDIVTPAGPPQLTRAFATACQRSIRGTDGVVKLGDADCSAVKAPSPASPTDGGNSGGDSAGSGGSDSNGGSQEGSDSPSGGGGGGGGGDSRVTTTDSGGNTVIMTVGGGDLYASVNAQGQTVVGTGAADAGPVGGQVTIVNSDGSTVVVQGGNLASPGAGDDNGVGITVTNVQGELVVIQGGQTGTLSAGPGGGTALIVGTLTQTSWVAGATIAGGETGSAEPTVQNETGAVRLPSLLELWAFLLSTTLVVALML